MATGHWMASALVAYHNAIEPRVPPRARPVTGLGAAAAAIALARRRGLTWDELGAPRGRSSEGLRWGLACAAAAAAAVGALAAIPRTRGMLRDERLRGRGPRKVAADALVRIPLGTALAEEAAFRGALYGILRRESGRRAALAISSIAFGLWHVAPALDQRGANPGRSRRARSVDVGAQVAATTAAGLALGLLRERTGGILAPAIAHWAVNASASLAAGR